MVRCRTRRLQGREDFGGRRAPVHRIKMDARRATGEKIDALRSGVRNAKLLYRCRVVAHSIQFGRELRGHACSEPFRLRSIGDRHDPGQDGNANAASACPLYKFEIHVVVVEQLRRNEIDTFVYFALQILQIQRRVWALLMLLRIARGTDAHTAAVQFADVTHKLGCVSKSAFRHLKCLLALGRIAAQCEDVLNAVLHQPLQHMRQLFTRRSHARQMRHRFNTCFTLDAADDVNGLLTRRSTGAVSYGDEVRFQDTQFSDGSFQQRGGLLRLRRKKLERKGGPSCGQKLPNLHLTIVSACVLILASAAMAQTVAVTVSNQRVNTFDPSFTLGAGIDGHEKGEVARFLSPANVVLMLTAGLKPLSYRLRTELAGEVWHWNPKGTWSDSGHRQGYWISDATPGEPIDLSYGYKLPRRGNTQDQANNDGYSRLDDGDPATFWKSNPYLDAQPQWVAVDLQKLTLIGDVRIQWGEPAAQDYTVQYSAAAETDPNSDEHWQDLPKATVRARWLRIVLRTSTHQASGSDPRDSLGFAIREIRAGTVDAAGQFHDVIHHASDGKRQTPMFVSSTDSWHRATDRDTRVEQPGFDRVFRSGLTNGLPALIPVPILYDTPENSAAQIRYLQARGYPVTEVEFGEEPEEQNVPPAFYGELFLKWSDALHAVDPKLKIGGPSLVLLQADQDREPSWTKRFFSYLRSRDALGAMAFFSFEWYPFDEVCEPVYPQLSKGAAVLSAALARLEKDGVPPTLPRYITEYGYSAYGAQPEVDITGALFNADIVGTFLAHGGTRAYLYGYEPNELINEKGCSWGNNMIFLDRPDAPPVKLATYYGAQLLTQQWAQPDGGAHEMFATSTSNADVGAYTVHRPDGQWSVLLINRSARLAHAIDVASATGSGDLYQYSRAQYQWQAHKDSGRPIRNDPPTHRQIGSTKNILLPPLSISVVRYRQQTPSIAGL